MKKLIFNKGVKKCSPLSPILFGIDIDMLRDCLEEGSCVGINLVAVVILLLYDDIDIFY